LKDFYTVQEFSRLSGVEASTLRYWDDIGLFTPLKRNPDNNYRYYTLTQILALNFVTTLSELEIPLKTIAELREDRTPEQLMLLLEKLEHKLDMEMRQLRMRYSIIHARRELINLGMKINEETVSVAHKDEKALILWPRNEYKEGDTFVEPLASYVQHAYKQHINLSFPVGGYYDNMESFIKNPSKPDRFFTLDPIGLYTYKAGEYLIGYARGEYGELGDLPERMAAYAKEHSISVSGPVFIMYLNNEICTKDPSLYLAQCSVQVSKPKRRR